MKYRVITPSTVFPCDLTFLKDQLRITHTAHDVYLASLIAAATDWAIGFTGRQINYATLQAYCFCGHAYIHREILIDRSPIIAISKVEYLNNSGTLVEIASGNFELQRDEYSGTIFIKDDFEFVEINTTRPDAIRITYTAGFGGVAAGAIAFPEIVRNAVALKAAQLYTRPEDGVDEKSTVSENLLRSMRCPIL